MSYNIFLADHVVNFNNKIFYKLLRSYFIVDFVIDVIYHQCFSSAFTVNIFYCPYLSLVSFVGICCLCLSSVFITCIFRRYSPSVYFVDIYRTYLLAVFTVRLFCRYFSSVFTTHIFCRYLPFIYIFHPHISHTQIINFYNLPVNYNCEHINYDLLYFKIIKNN